MPGMGGAAMQMEAPPETFTVEELMGVVARADQNAATVAAPTANGKFTGIDFEVTAADDVFERISQTCASCHSLYRKGN